MYTSLFEDWLLQTKLQLNSIYWPCHDRVSQNRVAASDFHWKHWICLLTYRSSKVKCSSKYFSHFILLEATSSQRRQMSDTLPDRQTEIWINQYPCHWVKSTSSSHVLWGVCSRLLILSGRLRWPLSHCHWLFWCKSGGGTNSSSHNSIRHLHIEHLHPQKICQYPLFLLPAAPAYSGPSTGG